jgi:hypothetical protein
MKRQRSFLLACLTASFLLAIPAHAAVITNGSFESPDIPESLLFNFFIPGQTVGAGWVVDSASDSAILVLRDVAATQVTVTDGDQYAVLGLAPDSGTIYQDITLDAADYQLSFQLGSDEANLDGEVSINVLRSGASIIGGPTSFGVSIGSDFQTRTLDFSTTQADTYRLVVAATGGAPALDAFQITSIPEPATTVLLSLFAVPIVLRRRRPSKK